MVIHQKNRIRTVLKTVRISSNQNTLKCELRSTVPLDSTSKNSIGRLLGFTKTQQILPNIQYESDEPVRIQTVNVIRFECNVIYNTYLNDHQSHTLHQFFLIRHLDIRL